MSVSVVLLTRDCAGTLRACLDSLRFADEIVALDGGSRDGTRAILAEALSVFHEQPVEDIRRHGGNFDVARNRGFDLATSEWILVVDADEVVPTALANEILAVTRSAHDVAYEIPRTNLFWGKPSRILGDDFQLRLFPRGRARYEGCLLDVRPVVACPVERLSQPLLHHQAHSLRLLLEKLGERTSQRARALAAAGATDREPAVKLFYYGFRYYYRLQGAWRDGWRGVVLSAVYATYPVLTQRKLARLRARGPESESDA